MLAYYLLATTYVIARCGIAATLDAHKPIVKVQGAIPAAMTVTVTHEKSGMVIYACFGGGEIAELLVGTVVIVQAVRQAALQPTAVGLDAKIVVTGAGQVAVPHSLSKAICARVTDDGMPYCRWAFMA